MSAMITLGHQAALLAAFADRIAVDPITGCWNWTGTLNDKGYGVLKIVGKAWRAHRYIWTVAEGRIAAGLTLDHRCRNRACVFPVHLEPVTNRVNVLRGIGISAQNARKTHCLQGHALSGDNVRTTRFGSRSCKECARLRYHSMKAQYRERVRLQRMVYRTELRRTLREFDPEAASEPAQ